MSLFNSNFITAFSYYANDEKKFNMMEKIANSFYESDVRLVKQNFSIVDINQTKDVVLVSTVKDDLERVRLLFDYYRKLGIKYYLILDNGSKDGTFEFLRQQKDVNLFLCNEIYETYRKEGWVNRMIASIGFNCWYLIVDSDELFDYIGSETHNIEDLINKMQTQDIKRGKGLLVDMYGKKPLFQSECDYMNIPKEFSYFDSPTSYRFVENSFVSHWEGGPRERVLGAERIWVSKSPLIYFDENSLVINAHYQFPLEEYEKAPYISLIRHYKYLKSDYKPFIERINKNNFANKSDFYRKAIELYNKNENIVFFDNNSKKYTSSGSIRCFDAVVNLFGDSDEIR